VRTLDELALDEGRSLKGNLLAILLAVVLSGVLQYFSYYFRISTYVVWAACLLLIALLAGEVPLGRLLAPSLPYLVWLGFYLAWALIVSPITNTVFAVKTFALTTLFVASAALVCARGRSLRTFANGVQFALAANLLLMFLLPRVSSLAAIIDTVQQNTSAFQLGVSRYGGLWGNPNMAGYICLVTTILSVLATPWIGWVGRLSALPLLFYAASRKALIMYFFIVLLYALISYGRSLKTWIFVGTVVAGLGLTAALNDEIGLQVRSASQNAMVARVLDVEERETTSRGGQTRVDLFHQWVNLLAAEPWYGYGLESMAGTIVDEKDPNKIISRGLFPLGTHNTYLGVLIEIGPIGFLAFLAVMANYARKGLFNNGASRARWVTAALVMCNLISLFVSHNHLFGLEGQVVFAFMFVLTASPGLWNLTRVSTP
jgi:O-antigen ligase